MFQKKDRFIKAIPAFKPVQADQISHRVQENPDKIYQFTDDTGDLPNLKIQREKVVIFFLLGVVSVLSWCVYTVVLCIITMYVFCHCCGLYCSLSLCSRFCSVLYGYIIHIVHTCRSTLPYATPYFSLLCMIRWSWIG